MQQDLSRRLVWVLGAAAHVEPLESVLAESQARCRRFTEPDALYERLEAQTPELVLVATEALKAPGELERFVDTLRRRLRKQVPLVAVTDDGSVQMRRRMFKAGIDDFVLAPVVPTELVARLSALLRLSRPRPPAIPAEAVHNDGGSGPSLARKSAANGALSVLVVDDETIIHRVLRSTFERRGWQVAQANDGREALDLAAKHQFDLVVFDLNLPFKNGFELLGELGGAAGARRPHMVVLSAEKQQESVLRAFELGADDFVSKPVNPDILVARIARLVRPVAGQ